MRPLLLQIPAVIANRIKCALFTAAILALPVSSSIANGTDACAFLEKLERQRQKVETFSAHFEQKKTVELFEEVKTSTGILLYKTPHQMIWKYESPDNTQMRIDRESVSFYFPQLEQIEIYPLQQGQSASYFFFAFEATARELDENFEVSPPEQQNQLTAVQLKPKTDPLASQLRSITLWLADDYLPRRIMITEANGDTTEVTLTHVRINEPIPDKELAFDAPEGTEVIKTEPGAF
ncbi:MAG: hypothetical protein Kow0099_03060 [Candidatus Abyssubacteria bacterium]